MRRPDNVSPCDCRCSPLQVVRLLIMIMMVTALSSCCCSAMLDFLGWAKDHNEKAARQAAAAARGTAFGGTSASASGSAAAGGGLAGLSGYLAAAQAAPQAVQPHPQLQPPPLQPFGLYGMDLYSLFESQREVVRYLRGVDPALGDRVKRMFEW